MRISARRARRGRARSQSTARRDRCHVALRGIGFAGMLAGVRTPVALVLPYLALSARLHVSGYFTISRASSSNPGLRHRCDQRLIERIAQAPASLMGQASMIARTLSRYFGLRFLSPSSRCLPATFVLVAMVDFVELLRRTGDLNNVSALKVAAVSLYRVPFITERVMPFTVLVAAMLCYLNLSRRLELVVARAAGMSAWQFIAPAVFHCPPARRRHDDDLQSDFGDACASARRGSKPRLFGSEAAFRMSAGSGFWMRQRSEDGQAIINAKTSQQQGIQLGRGERSSGSTRTARSATASRPKARRSSADIGGWTMPASMPAACSPPASDVYRLPTTLTPAQVGESFATPETVPFWQLSSLHRGRGECRPGGGRLSPAVLSAPRAAVLSRGHGSARRLGSLRFFRMGGVQKFVIGGVACRLRALRAGQGQSAT